MKKGVLLIFALVLTLSMSGFASAYAASLSDFVSSYGPGDALEGILKLKLSEDSTDLMMSATFDGASKSIMIKDLLNNSNIPYSCSPSSCKDQYSKGNSETTKIIPSGTNYVAFVVEKGKDVQVLSLSFDLSSDNGIETCGISPIKIDLLNDGTTDWEYNEPSPNYCSEMTPSTYYNPAVAQYEAVLTDSPYCEKMNLVKSGRFKLGVDMINKSNEMITLSIRDAERGYDESCQTAAINGIATCEVNFTASEKKDYYICASSGYESNHLIKSETESITCGYGFSASEDFQAFDCEDTSTDYALFAAPANIAAFNNKTAFDSNSFSNFNDGDLGGYIQNYIDFNYYGNCSQTCIIPMKLELNQAVTLSNLNFKYSATGIGTYSQQKFYSSSRIPAKMTLNETEVGLSNSRITVPSSYGSYAFALKIGTNTLKDTTIKVEQVPIISSVTPLDAAALVPVKFSAIVRSPKNNSISEYYWDFGDGTSETTETPFVNHSYGLGTFKLSLKAVDSKGLTATKIFDITTQAPKNYIDASLKKKRANINSLNNDIANIPKWYVSIINDRLNMKKMSSDLAILENDFANPDADYAGIKISLDSFVTYTSIKDDNIGSSPVSPTVNLNQLKEFEQIEAANEEETARELNDWNKNVQVRASYLVKYALADTSPENNIDLATVLNVKTTSDYDKTAYLFLSLPEGIRMNDTKLNGQYDVQEGNGFMIFSFNDLKDQNIEIAIPGRWTDISMFASPSAENLFLPNIKCGNKLCDAEEDYKTCPADCPKPLWIPIFWSVIVWAIVAGAIYWIWKYYAKRYDLKMQEKLFKEKADYVKLTSFIAEELNKGEDGKSIRKELVEAGWKNDQIEYAMTKVLKQTLEFQRQTVLNFIIGEKDSGKLDGEITAELRKAGWSHSIIGWAFSKFKKIQKRKRF